MKYVIEVTVKTPDGEASPNPMHPQSRVEAVDIEAENVPEAIAKAKEKFRGQTITNTTVRFR